MKAKIIRDNTSGYYVICNNMEIVTADFIEEATLFFDSEGINYETILEDAKTNYGSDFENPKFELVDVDVKIKIIK